MLFKEEDEIESIDFKPIESISTSKTQENNEEISQMINDYLENSVDYLQLSTLDDGIPHPISLEGISDGKKEDSMNLDDHILENNMIHVQLPKILPMLDKESTIAGSRGENITQQKLNRRKDNEDINYISSRVEELPSGYLGKLKIYRNGTKKLDIGGTLYNVSDGANSTSLEKFACYIPETEEFVLLSDNKNNLDSCDRRLIVSVDVNSMLLRDG